MVLIDNESLAYRMNQSAMPHHKKYIARTGPIVSFEYSSCMQFCSSTHDSRVSSFRSGNDLNIAPSHFTGIDPVVGINPEPVRNDVAPDGDIECSTCEYLCRTNLNPSTC